MAKSRYTVHVPAFDEQGNPLRIQHAVHQHLLNLGHPAPSIRPGHPFHEVSTWAEDSPEMDSTMKQIGTYVGDTANVPSVDVTKEGENTAHWPMPNAYYQPGYPAEQDALANERNISDIGIQYPDEGMGGIPKGMPMPSEISTNPLPTAMPLTAQVQRQR